MKLRTWLLAALAAGLIGAPAAHAQEVRYWGRAQGTEPRGVIDWHGRYYSVAAGDEIPGVGRVTQVTDEALVVEQALTEADKDRLAAQGLAAPDAKARRLPNLSRMLGPQSP